MLLTANGHAKDLGSSFSLLDADDILHEKKVEDLWALIDELQTQLGSLEEQIRTDVEAVEDKCLARLEKIRKKGKSQRKKIERKRLDTLKSNVKQQKEIERLHEDIEAEETRIAQLQNRNLSLEHDLERSTKRVETLKPKMPSLRQEFFGLLETSAKLSTIKKEKLTAARAAKSDYTKEFDIRTNLYSGLGQMFTTIESKCWNEELIDEVDNLLKRPRRACQRSQKPKPPKRADSGKILPVTDIELNSSGELSYFSGDN